MRQMTWIGRPVNENSDHFEKIRGLIPTFSREGFKIDGQENEHLDMIVKLPRYPNDTKIPVATVSKSYSLIQHREILNEIESALKTMGYPIENFETDLQLTIYGERMWLRITFQEEHSFDPGDGYPLTLQLHVINSVDGSTPLTYEMCWFRLICENGLMQSNSASARIRHTASLDKTKFVELLDSSINEMRAEADAYMTWYEIPLNPGTQILEDWIDSTVNNKWGFRLAARSYHIIKTGMDGRVDKVDATSAEKRKAPHTIKVSSEQSVPGAIPAENVYDVANALSWIASHRNSLQTRYNYMKAMPELLADLNQRL